jgi:peptide deformylase
MPPRTILLYPNSLLKQVSTPVAVVDEEIRMLIRDLIDTMQAGPGSVGVAAPQIGVNLRVCVVDVSKSKLGKDNNHSLLIMVNPEILRQEGAFVMREGCMSVPDYTGDVERAVEITVRFFDENGKVQTIESSAFEAVAIQHEIDHLDGLLFLDRITSLKTGLFRRKKYK